jgi:hypothetical protein
MKLKLVAAAFGICLLFISYVIAAPLGTLIGGNTDTAWAELITQFKRDIRDISQAYGYYDWEDMDVLPGETEVVYFSQKDAAWASNYYDTRQHKTQTIRSGGCGPTSMAIVYTSLTHEVMNPGQTAEWAMEHGYCAAPNGSYRSLFTTGAAELGLTNVYSGEDLEAALGYLSEGKLIVALMGPGIFCDGGHFVVIRGITEEGKILIADCWNESNNDVEWEIGTIAENLKTDGANCLWVLGYEGSEDE